MEYYKLVSEENGQCEAVFARNKKMTGCLDGDLYTVSSWCDKEIGELDYVSTVYMKWDACSHFWFNGDGYTPGNKDKEINPYYHICGSYGYKDFMRCIAFVYKLASEVMKDGHYDYEEFNEILEINEKLLEGYKIEKVDNIEYFEIREIYNNKEGK